MLKQRVITAAVLLVVFSGFLFVFPSFWFSIFVSVVAGLGAWEWARLARVSDARQRIVYGVLVAAVSLLLLVLPYQQQIQSVASLLALVFWFAAVALLFFQPVKPARNAGELDVGLLAAGVFVLSVTAISLRALHNSVDGSSPYLLLYALSVVWVMDIGAYFAGRRFGRVKLAPKISPGKTREGVYGGLVCTFLLTLLVLAFSSQMRSAGLALILATLLSALVSVAGDLYESRLKRAAGLKDSSNLLPGHGGVLDRIDGVVAALPLFLFIWIWV